MTHPITTQLPYRIAVLTIGVHAACIDGTLMNDRTKKNTAQTAHPVAIARTASHLCVQIVPIHAAKIDVTTWRQYHVSVAPIAVRSARSPASAPSIPARSSSQHP